MIKKTRLLSADEVGIAARMIADGRVVVFATETVYGLGASAYDDAACRAIFIAKGRPADNPCIVHILDDSRLDDVIVGADEITRALFRVFSPGPITVVGRKHESIAPTATGGLDTVAVRIPAHPSARSILDSAGVPVAAPSANRSGKPSPTTFLAAVEAMRGRVDAILDGGTCNVGLESTVVTTEPGYVRILRPGAITAEMIHERLGVRVEFAHGGESRVSPGTRHPHYRPDACVLAVEHEELESTIARVREEVQSQPGRGAGIGVIVLGDVSPSGSCAGSKGDGAAGSPGTTPVVFPTVEAMAAGLYETLLEFDRRGCGVVIIELPPPRGLGIAVRDRVSRAAGRI